MKIKYIKWNYGKQSNYPYEYLHLIRLYNGEGLIRTTSEMIRLGYC
jgi:hypothetical protein